MADIEDRREEEVSLTGSEFPVYVCPVSNLGHTVISLAIDL